MIKTIAQAVLVLSISLLLSLPAASEQKSQNAGEDSDRCADELLQCVYDCTWLENDNDFAACNQQCNEDFGSCSRGDIAQTADPTGGGGGKKPKGTHTVGVGALGEAEVERACRSVGGLFAQVSNGFGCVNQACGKGNCTLGCIGQQCYAITPDPLPASVTLLGILQNGNNVVRDPKAGGAPQSLSDGVPGSPAPTTTTKPSKG